MLNTLQLYTNALKFIKSTDFAKALLVTVGVVLPILIGYYLDELTVGIALGTGVLFSSPSSVTGSVKNKRIGILLSTVIATIVSFVGAYIPQNLGFQLPYLGIMTFLLSFIAVYGFRASLIGFSGLFALVLSFANLSASGMPPYERSLLIGLGGLWYLALTLIYDLLAPKRQVEELMQTALTLSADYIDARRQFLEQNINRDAGYKRLFAVQSNFNEHLEKLREILLDSRHSSGTSSYYRRRFLVLRELVDLSELSLTSPLQPLKMHETLKKYPEQLQAFIKLNKAQSESLKRIAESKQKNKSLNLSLLDDALENASNQLKNYLKAYTRNEDYIILQNLYELQQKQAQSIIIIAQLLDRNKTIAGTTKKAPRELEDFITKQDFSFQVIPDNLNIKAPIFRHALRISCIAVLGFALGNFFKVQNPYWILLTIVVIMRPSYGLTKQRSKQRIIGTLIGAAIATGIVYLFHDKMLFRILAVVSFVMAHASLQKNYRTGALFITLSIIFAYALLKPDVLSVIQFRVLDTAAGALLAGLANIFLWPTKEAKNLQHNLAESLLANQYYLQMIREHYQTKNEISFAYKLARKNAFLATATVNAAIQRLLQEPSANSKLTGKLYELVVLNHAFLGSLASIGSYLRTHKTTKMDATFAAYTDPILQDINNAVALLENLPQETNQPSIFEKTIEISANMEDNEVIYEAHIVTEQLKWLKKLTEQFMKQLRVLNT